MNFIFPEKPKRVYDIKTVPSNYQFQIKKDGHRAIIIINGEVKIYNRHGAILNAGKKFNWEWLSKVFPKGTILDGELVGARQAGQINDTIVIWDCPFFKEENLLDKSLSERHGILEKLTSNNILPINNGKLFGTSYLENEDGMSICLSKNFDLSDYQKCWMSLDNYFDEGLVFKNPKANLNWNYVSTTESINQLKLLKK